MMRQKEFSTEGAGGGFFKPSWATAVTITILFGLCQYLLLKAIGVDYTTIGDNTENVTKAIITRFAITGSIFMILAIVLNKVWGGGIFRQKAQQLKSIGWIWILPIAIILTSVVRLALNHWDRFETSYIGVITVGVILVGITEELVFRGIIVRAIRGATTNEFTVMLGSSLLFGLVHGINFFNGQGLLQTLGQVAAAAASGAGLYVTLRLSGSLVLPMFLHALWDLGVLTKLDDNTSIALPSLVGQIIIWGVILLSFRVIFKTSSLGVPPRGKASS